MRKNEPDIRAARECAAGKKTVNVLRGLDVEVERAGLAREVAASGPHGMEEHDGFPAIQFIENRGECGIARPLVAIGVPESDAVGFERAERVLDFLQAAVLIG